MAACLIWVVTVMMKSDVLRGNLQYTEIVNPFVTFLAAVDSMSSVVKTEITSKFGSSATLT